MFSINNEKGAFVPNKQPLKRDLEDFIYKWNIVYPIDRWWREKHSVSFNSPEHRDISFLDMYLEYLEDKIILKARSNFVKNHQYKKGDWLEEHIEEVDIQKEIEEFEKMDLSRFDDKDK